MSDRIILPLLTRRIVLDKEGNVISDTKISHIPKLRAAFEAYEILKREVKKK